MEVREDPVLSISCIEVARHGADIGGDLSSMKMTDLPSWNGYCQASSSTAVMIGVGCVLPGGPAQEVLLPPI